MNQIDEIANRIHQSFEARTLARDQALSQARTLTRHCSNAIRAVHRDETSLAQDELSQAAALASVLRTNLANHPDLFFAGYTQDALKEFAEACLVFALVGNQPLPSPEELNLPYDTYLKGLAEAVGELRRRTLDILRHGYSDEAERLLGIMDDVYGVMVSMDYPDAITGGLRRMTDLMRGIVERTRGDLTIAIRQEHLEQSLKALEQRLNLPPAPETPFSPDDEPA